MTTEVVNDEGTTKLKTKYYWSRSPGKFVNKLTGQAVSLSSNLSIGPAFTGTVREWYETLVETIIDVFNTVQEETNAIYAHPDTLVILEATMLYRLALNVPYAERYADLVKAKSPILAGQLVRKDVYCDPSLPRNIIKIGHHNGGSWWEGEIEVLDMNII